MLDLDNPQTQYIFAAAKMSDDLMIKAEQMTLLSREYRGILLEDCFEVLNAMRRLNREQFKASERNAKAVDAIEAALNQLAHLNDDSITEDKTDGEGYCAACGSLITIQQPPSYSLSSRPRIRCDCCMKIFWPARTKLQNAFGIMFI